ncbi:hypothetical protein HDU82_000339, partial [Entophlyctis luteolus]
RKPAETVNDSRRGTESEDKSLVSSAFMDPSTRTLHFALEAADLGQAKKSHAREQSLVSESRFSTPSDDGSYDPVSIEAKTILTEEPGQTEVDDLCIHEASSAPYQILENRRQCSHKLSLIDDAIGAINSKFNDSTTGRRVSLKEVLCDQWKAPFSLKDFSKFLRKEHSEENIEFYFALQKYVEICENVPEPLLRNVVATDLESLETGYLAHAMIAIIGILDKFFAQRAPCQLNIPDNISKNIIDSVKKKRSIHPEIFKAALSNVIEMMRLSSFPNFLKTIGDKPELVQKTSCDSRYRGESISEDEASFMSLMNRKFSLGNILHKLECWQPGQKYTEESSAFDDAAPKEFDRLHADKCESPKPGHSRNQGPKFEHLLNDSYMSPYGLSDLIEFMESEHSQENIQFCLAFEDYKAICKKVPDSLLADISTVTNSSPFSGVVGKIKILLEDIFDKYLKEGSKSELNIPSVAMKAFSAAWVQKRDLRPAILNPIANHVVETIKMSSIPKFHKIASSKGPLKLKVTIESLLYDELQPPLSLNDFHNFVIREGRETSLEFCLAIKESNQTPLTDQASTFQSSFGSIASLHTRSKIHGIAETFFSDDSNSKLPDIPDAIKTKIWNEINSKKVLTAQVFDEAFELVKSQLTNSCLMLFLKENNRKSTLPSSKGGSRRVSNAFELRFCAPSQNHPEAKPSVMQILEDECLPPFSCEDFREFLIGHNMDRFLDLYMDIKNYQSLCKDLPTEVLKDSTKVSSADTGLKVIWAQSALERIQEKYFGSSAPKIPDDIKENITKANEMKSFVNPEILDPVLQLVLKTLGDQTLDLFYNTTFGLVKLKPSFQNLMNNLLPSPMSISDFREFLLQNNAALSLDYTVAVKSYQSLCAVIPGGVLANWSQIDSESQHYRAATTASAAAERIFNDFIYVEGSSCLDIDSEARAIAAQCMAGGDISPEIFAPITAQVLSNLKILWYPKFLAFAEQTTPAVRKKAEASRGLRKLRITTNKFSSEKSTPVASPTRSSALFHSPWNDIKNLGKMFQSRSQTSSMFSKEDMCSGSDSSFIVPSNEAKPAKRPQMQFSVIQVLEDQLLPPFSRKDFYEFMKKEHSEENYDFYTAVRDYQTLCEKIPAEVLRNVTRPVEDKALSFKLERAVAAIDSIRKKFFTPGGVVELNLPSNISRPLLHILSSKECIHPEIFDLALENILSMMRLSSFPVFWKTNITKGEPKLRTTIYQILENVLPPPMSLEDFREFLKDEHCVENLEFYLAFKKYDKLFSELSSAGSISDSSRSKLSAEVSEITKMFISKNATLELNVPVGMKDGLLNIVASKNVIYPADFNEIVEHIVSLLRQSCLPNFLKYVAKNAEASRSENVTGENKKEEVCAGVAAAAGKNLIEGYPSTPTMDEIFGDEFYPPYSLHDYEVFLSNPDDLNDLEFYSSFKDHQFLCRNIPDEHLRNSKMHTNSETSAALVSAAQILTSHFTRGSVHELHGVTDIAKYVTKQVNELRNIHPEVFQHAAHSILKRHSELFLSNFLKAAEVKGPVHKRPQEISQETSVMSVDDEDFQKKAGSKWVHRLSKIVDGPRNSQSLMASVRGKIATGKPKQDAGLKFGVRELLEDMFLPPFSMKDFQRFLIREYSDENLDFYLAMREYTKYCESIPENYLRGIGIPKDQKALENLEKAKAMLLDIINTYFTAGGERELNIPSNILKSLIKEVKASHNFHPDVAKDALETVLVMLRLSSFPNFCKQALEKGPVMLKYTLQQVLDDQLLPPVSLKGKLLRLKHRMVTSAAAPDFHNFLIRDHSSENLEFYQAVRRHQQLHSSYKNGDATVEQCRASANDIFSKFLANKAPFELNAPQSLRTSVANDIERQNFSPDIFKPLLENVVTLLKLSCFPKFQKEVQVSVQMEDTGGAAAWSPLPSGPAPRASAATGTLPESPAVATRALLEIDPSSRISTAGKILARIGLQHFTIDDDFVPTSSDASPQPAVRDRLSAILTAGPDGSIQFSQTQTKSALLQTLDDKFPPPLSCRDFRTHLKKEKKAQYVDFYLAVKRYRRLCDKIPEGLLNNPSNISQTNSQNPTSSSIPRVKIELDEIIHKYADPESKWSIGLPTQLRQFLNSEVNMNGNWTPRIFDRAVLHVISTMQQSSFPEFFKLATTKAKGVKLKIVCTKKTSKGVQIEAPADSQPSKVENNQTCSTSDDYNEYIEIFPNLDAADTSKAGRLSNLLFQVMSNRTESPISRSDFYAFLKREHAEENFDFFMSVMQYRKIFQTATNEEVREAAMKIVDSFLHENAHKEIALTCKAKTAILQAIRHDSAAAVVGRDVFNHALVEVFASLRASSFPSFYNEHIKEDAADDDDADDNNDDDDAGLHTIVPEDLERHEPSAPAPAARASTAPENPLVAQILHDRLAPPFSLA